MSYFTLWVLLKTVHNLWKYRLRLKGQSDIRFVTHELYLWIVMKEISKLIYVIRLFRENSFPKEIYNHYIFLTGNNQRVPFLNSWSKASWHIKTFWKRQFQPEKPYKYVLKCLPLRKSTYEFSLVPFLSVALLIILPLFSRVYFFPRKSESFPHVSAFRTLLSRNHH